MAVQDLTSQETLKTLVPNYLFLTRHVKSLPSAASFPSVTDSELMICHIFGESGKLLQPEKRLRRTSYKIVTKNIWAMRILHRLCE